MNKFWRAFITLFCFAFFGFGAGIISFVIFPYISIFKPKATRKFEYAKVIHLTWKFFTNLLEKIRIIKVDCTDRESLANLSGKIVVASHPSFIDIVILIGLIPNSTCLAKKETLKNPLFRNIVSSLYIINDIELEDFKSETDKFLKEGFNIIIFPTGTRTKAGEEIKLHKGSAVISINSNVEIIPIKITTSFPFLGKQQPIYDVGSETVIYNLEVKSPISPLNITEMTDIKKRKKIMARIKTEI